MHENLSRIVKHAERFGEINKEDIPVLLELIKDMDQELSTPDVRVAELEAQVKEGVRLLGEWAGKYSERLDEIATLKSDLKTVREIGVESQRNVNRQLTKELNEARERQKMLEEKLAFINQIGSESV
jgi:uncharacterized coiled-coil DUF342 family protein